MDTKIKDMSRTRIDLVGQRFGKLVVQAKADPAFNKKGYAISRWNCICDCGNNVIVREHNLKTGHTISCGCVRIQKNQENKRSLVGLTFNRLTVVKEAKSHVFPSGKTERAWWCKCNCGNPLLIYVTDHNLVSGHTKSCGCYREEIQALRDKNNIYEFHDSYCRVYTETKEKSFLIDKTDYDLVKDYYWNINKSGYVYTRNKNRVILLHKLLFNDLDNSFIIDHINNDRTDNRRCNLRIVTNQQNIFNSKLSSNNTSGVTGVYWIKQNSKWLASIQRDYKSIYLGYFDNKEDAIAARKAAEEKYFGAFSYDASQKIAEKNKIND